MGRYLSEAAAGSADSTTGSSADAVFSQVVAGENIQKGDIVSQYIDGKVYWCSDQNNNSTGGALRPIVVCSDKATVSVRVRGYEEV